MSYGDWDEGEDLPTDPRLRRSGPSRGPAAGGRADDLWEADPSGSWETGSASQYPPQRDQTGSFSAVRLDDLDDIIDPITLRQPTVRPGDPPAHGAARRRFGVGEHGWSDDPPRDDPPPRRVWTPRTRTDQAPASPYVPGAVTPPAPAPPAPAPAPSYPAAAPPPAAPSYPSRHRPYVPVPPDEPPQPPRETWSETGTGQYRSPGPYDSTPPYRRPAASAGYAEPAAPGYGYAEPAAPTGHGTGAYGAVGHGTGEYLFAAEAALTAEGQAVDDAASVYGTDAPDDADQDSWERTAPARRPATRPPGQPQGTRPGAQRPGPRPVVLGGGAPPPSVGRPAGVPTIDEPEPEPEAESDGTYRGAVMAALVWCALPVVFYIAWALVLAGKADAGCVKNGVHCAGPRVVAWTDLLYAAPMIGATAVLSVLVALLLRRVTTGWRSTTVGFASAVVGAGLVTVLWSALVRG